MADEDDHKRTISYGESAISYIKKNTLPAYPRSYELWYTYSAGYNQGLNRAVNETIKNHGRISTDQMLTLYGRFLSPTRLGDRLENRRIGRPRPDRAGEGSQGERRGHH